MTKAYLKPSFSEDAFHEWHIPSNPQCLGYVPFPVAAYLIRKGLFRQSGPGLELTATHHDKAYLDARLEDVRDALCSEGLIVPHRGEAMDVAYHFNVDPIAHIDRSALRILGIWATKVHVNGVVASEHNEPQIWLSQRSDAANAAPGHWDTLVAGGKASNVSVLDTAIKEGWEEAGITEDLMAEISDPTRMPCIYLSPQGMHRELLVSHTLFLPETFEPRCNDGEVQNFIRVNPETLTTIDGAVLPLKFSSKLVLTATNAL